MRIQVHADSGDIVDSNSVVGFALISVVKTEEGGLDVNRDFHVQSSWSEEDKQVATDFLKRAEEKLSELFPEEKISEPTLWVPNGN